MANELKLGNKLVILNGNPITLPVAASDPGTASQGDFYYNSTSQSIRYYNGTSWEGVGGVSSVALSDGDSTSIFSFSGSPITSSGTISISLANQAANLILAGPGSGSAAQPSFRSLVSADIPAINLATSGAGGVSGILGYANGGTNANTAALAFANLSPMTTAGDIIYENAVPAPARLPIGTNGYILTVVSGLPAWAAAPATGANTALSNLASVAINASLVPGSAGSIDLGSNTLYWRNAYISMIRDTSANNSIDPVNRLLIDSSGATQLAWSTSGVNITKLSAALNANSNKITSLAAGTVSTDAVNYGQVILASGVNAWTASQSLGGFTITNSGTPVNPNDLVPKTYVDNLINGTSWKTAVLVATTANITLSGEQTIDGVLTSSSRVLVKNQSSAAQNGIYVSSSSGWTRSTDMATWAEVVAAAVFVESGTVNADLGWVCTSQPGGTLGTTAINFVQFSASGAYSADGVTLQLISGVFSIKNGGVGVTQLGSITDGITLDQSGSGSTLEVKTGGISNTQISASAAIAFSKLASLSTGQLVVGNGGIATATTLSGDATISASGVLTISANAVTLGKLAALAANSVIANVTGSSATPTAVSLLSTATASAVMIRDANANVAINNINEAFATTATAAATTTLNASSPPLQQFTGTTTQIVALPTATTLAQGWQFWIYNRSTGAITVKDAGGTTLQVMAGGSQATFTCSSAVTTAGTWDISYTTTGAANAITALTGDVTATGPGSVAAQIAAIQGTTVSGTTGTTNVVFSASPTLTGTALIASATVSGTLTSPNLTSTAALLLNANAGASSLNIEALNVRRSTDATNFITETYVDSTSLTDNQPSATTVSAFTFAYASFAGQEIVYVIESGDSNKDCRVGTIRVTANNSGTIVASLSDVFTETADCGVTWSASISGSNVVVQYTTTNQGAARTMRADVKTLRR